MGLESNGRTLNAVFYRFLSIDIAGDNPNNPPNVLILGFGGEDVRNVDIAICPRDGAEMMRHLIDAMAAFGDPLAVDIKQTFGKGDRGEDDTPPTNNS